MGRRRHVRNGFDGTSRRERRLLSSKAVSSFPNRKRFAGLRFGFLENLPGRCRGRCRAQPLAALLPYGCGLPFTGTHRPAQNAHPKRKTLRRIRRFPAGAYGIRRAGAKKLPRIFRGRKLGSWDLTARAAMGYEVRSHWISCDYKIAPRMGKVCRTLSRRNFFPAAAALLALRAGSC